MRCQGIIIVTCPLCWSSIKDDIGNYIVSRDDQFGLSSMPHWFRKTHRQACLLSLLAAIVELALLFRERFP